MKTQNLIPNTPEWLAYRKSKRNASDAPAMMGCNPYKSRTQLLHEMHTGLTPEVDAATQRRFDEGHRIEALARPLAEEIIGMDLYPVVGSMNEYSASFDGLTMDESIAFEHKTLNDELRNMQHFVGQELPIQHRIQMEQQLMVSGADKCLFMASKWDGDDLIEERHCWYAPDLALRAEIGQGWIQFKKDLAAYIPAEVVAQAVGHTPETLPALRIEVTGMVTASNLAQYKEHALAVFAGINRELTTDQHFADADKVVKWCGDVEDRLTAAKQHALSQTESIDALFRTIDDISTEARRVRLELGKLIAARKEQVRIEIVNEGAAAVKLHLTALNARLGKPYMPAVPVDFAGAIKGKRTIDSLRDAVSTTLANAKIAASAIADRIQINLATLQELGSEHKFLFADTAQIVLKANDDLAALVKLRIADHQAEVQRKEAETRERIRAEEQAKAEKAVRDAQEAEDSLIQSFEKNARRIEFDSVPYIEKATRTYESTGGDWENDLRPRVVAAFLAGREYLKERLEAAAQRDQTTVPAPAANVAPTRIPTPQESATRILAARLPDVRKLPELKLGQMAERLGFALTAAFLSELGFEPAATDKMAKLYHEADFPFICRALIEHIEAVYESEAA